MPKFTETVPVRIRGVVYPSQKEAAAALNVHPTVISRALDAGTLDSVGLNPRGPRMSKPVTINGVTYKSLREATYNIDMPLCTLQRRIREQGYNLTLKLKDTP